MRYDYETSEPDTWGIYVSGHNGWDERISDRYLAYYCECGQRFYPDCDISAASINAAFNTHRLNIMPERQFHRLSRSFYEASLA